MLRGGIATLELKQGPASFGGQQWRILDNERKFDPAIPREWYLYIVKILGFNNEG